MWQPDPFVGLSISEIDALMNPEPKALPADLAAWFDQASDALEKGLTQRDKPHLARGDGAGRLADSQRPSQTPSGEFKCDPLAQSEQAAPKPAIVPIEALYEALSYDPGSGDLTWRTRPVSHFKSDAGAQKWNTRNANQTAGGLNEGGYLSISLGGQSLLAHRVAWAMTTGQWPDGVIDHIDHNRSNNRAGNLRDVSQAENARNLSQFVTNTSGVTGVSWHKASARWRAQIGNGQHLGTFERFADAVAMRKAAERDRGYHENHGKSANL